MEVLAVTASASVTLGVYGWVELGGAVNAVFVAAGIAGLTWLWFVVRRPPAG